MSLDLPIAEAGTITEEIIATPAEEKGATPVEEKGATPAEK